MKVKLPGSYPPEQSVLPGEPGRTEMLEPRMPGSYAQHTRSPGVVGPAWRWRGSHSALGPGSLHKELSPCLSWRDDCERSVEKVYFK